MSVTVRHTPSTNPPMIKAVSSTQAVTVLTTGLN